MKQLFISLLAAFALTAFAADPAPVKTEKPKEEMKLAKKKKDKEAEKKAATKSPKKTENTKK